MQGVTVGKKMFVCVLYFPHNEHLIISVKNNDQPFGLYVTDNRFSYMREELKFGM